MCIVMCFVLQFGDEYLQFCAELALDTLKKDRFVMDTSKIKRDEAQCDVATEALTNSCLAIAKLFNAHDQMAVVCVLCHVYTP